MSVQSGDIHQINQILVYLSIQRSQADLLVLNFIVAFYGQFRGPLSWTSCCAQAIIPRREGTGAWNRALSFSSCVSWGSHFTSLLPTLICQISSRKLPCPVQQRWHHSRWLHHSSREACWCTNGSQLLLHSHFLGQSAGGKVWRTNLGKYTKSIQRNLIY